MKVFRTKSKFINREAIFKIGLAWKYSVHTNAFQLISNVGSGTKIMSNFSNDMLVATNSYFHSIFQMSVHYKTRGLLKEYFNTCIYSVCVGYSLLLVTYLFKLADYVTELSIMVAVIIDT